MLAPRELTTPRHHVDHTHIIFRTMGKQSKRIHRWSIYLQDLRAEYDRCVEGKFMESDKLVRIAPCHAYGPSP